MTNKAGTFFTFVEKNGPRVAASVDKDGNNLPGGSGMWDRRDEVPFSEPRTSGLVGFGNAAEIATAVRERGFLVLQSEKPSAG